MGDENNFDATNLMAKFFSQLPSGSNNQPANFSPIGAGNTTNPWEDMMRQYTAANKMRDPTMLDKLGTAAGIAQGLAGIYFGSQGLKMGKEQFAHNRDVDKINLYNQGTAINTSQSNNKAASLASAGLGGTPQGQSLHQQYMDANRMKTSFDGAS